MQPTRDDRRTDIDDDFDDLRFDSVPDVDANPDFRATVVDGRVTVLFWWPGLFRGGPMRPLLDERDRAGVTIADLSVVGQVPERDVIVTFVARGRRRRAEQALAEWARATGYRRIWFPDRVVTFDSGVDGLPSASTTCSNCEAVWRDDDHRFWVTVRKDGHFPNTCPLCGGDLPQWRVDGHASVGSRRSKAPRRTAGSRPRGSQRPRPGRTES